MLVSLACDRQLKHTDPLSSKVASHCESEV